VVLWPDSDPPEDALCRASSSVVPLRHLTTQRLDPPKHVAPHDSGSTEWHRHRSESKRYRIIPEDDLIPTVVGVQNSFRCKDLFRTTKRGVHSEKYSDSKLFLED
jgi:hypothetical protein